jgi:hypothetical protein
MNYDRFAMALDSLRRNLARRCVWWPLDPRVRLGPERRPTVGRTSTGMMLERAGFPRMSPVHRVAGGKTLCGKIPPANAKRVLYPGFDTIFPDVPLEYSSRCGASRICHRCEEASRGRA